MFILARSRAALGESTAGLTLNVKACIHNKMVTSTSEMHVCKMLPPRACRAGLTSSRSRRMTVPRKLCEADTLCHCSYTGVKLSQACDLPQECQLCHHQSRSQSHTEPHPHSGPHTSHACQKAEGRQTSSSAAPWDCITINAGITLSMGMNQIHGQTYTAMSTAYKHCSKLTGMLSSRCCA